MSSPTAGSGARALGQFKRAATLRGARYSPFDGALPKEWLTPMNATENTVTGKRPKLPPPMPAELLFEKRRGYGSSLLVEFIGTRLFATLYRKMGSKRQTLNRTDCTSDVCFIRRTIHAGTAPEFALEMLGSKFVISKAEAKKLKDAYGLGIQDRSLIQDRRL